eukprot:747982-Hanusia_phi.AAC.3
MTKDICGPCLTFDEREAKREEEENYGMEEGSADEMPATHTCDSCSDLSSHPHDLIAALYVDIAMIPTSMKSCKYRYSQEKELRQLDPNAYEYLESLLGKPNDIDKDIDEYHLNDVFEEARIHQQELEKLQESDPSFYDYLQSNDRGKVRRNVALIDSDPHSRTSSSPTSLFPSFPSLFLSFSPLLCPALVWNLFYVIQLILDSWTESVEVWHFI